MTAKMIARMTGDRAERNGWRRGTSLENRVSGVLHSFGYRPYGSTVVEPARRGHARVIAELKVHEQYKVGRYRLDFAWPDVKVALEADGWQHQRPETAARDAARDAALRDQGWLVFRVHDNPETLADQVAAVARVVVLLHERR